MTPFEIGFQKRANELGVNQLGDADAARMMQLIAQQKLQHPDQSGALDRFAGVQPTPTPTPTPAPAVAQPPVVTMPKVLPQINPTPPTINPQQPTEQMFKMPAKTGAFQEGFVKKAHELGFSKQEIAIIYKAAQGEQQALQPQAPQQAPQQAIPPELLQQLVQLLQQQQGGGGEQPAVKPDEKQQLMAYLAAQNQGGQKPVA